MIDYDFFNVQATTTMTCFFIDWVQSLLKIPGFNQSSSHPAIRCPEGLVSWYSISGKNGAMEDVILVICAARELRFFWQIFHFERMGYQLDLAASLSFCHFVVEVLSLSVVFVFTLIG